MKKILLLLLLFPFITAAQPAGQWTWMKGTGSATTTSTPVYGIQGVESVPNTPGSLYESCEWTDKQGNFWIFGGLDPNGVQMGDLWMFNPVSSNWTWVKGPGIGNQTGFYGIQGIPSLANQPGGRAWGIVSWIDNSGTFWMFGGYGFDGTGTLGYLNDLWSYDIASNQWTWVSGSNSNGATGTYGTQGVANPANAPTSLCESNAGWTDAIGNLWLFGGYNQGLYYNALWKYDVAANEWTWVRGSNSYGSLGNYGVEGVGNSTNDPPSRYSYARWKDASGNFWMFAGNATTLADVNDLWQYNPAANEWTWVNGPNTGGSLGVTGPLCVAAATNLPASRYENRAVWTDQCGNFYNFGGFNSAGTYNDLWQYNPATNQWKLVSGGGAPGSLGSYGLMGVSSSVNMPSSRFGSNAFTDAAGNFWLFGGWQTLGGDRLNDLWRYVPDSSCTGSCSVSIIPPVASFLASDTVLCAYDCISYTNLSTNATFYQWSFDGGLPPMSTDSNPQNICYFTAGTYASTLIAINNGRTDTLKYTNYIFVSPSPPTPVITQSNDTLFCSFDSSFASYQWYFNDTLLTGQTNPFLKINKNGNYNIAVKNSFGCSISVGIIILDVQNLSSENSISLYPNPARDNLQLATGNGQFANCKLQIYLYNVLGQICSQSEITNHQSSITIDVSNLPQGIYFLQVSNGGKRWTSKFVKG